MVKVFKTNVWQKSVARQVISLIKQHYPGAKVNFDLEDCDKVLRVEAESILTGKIIIIVNEWGHECSLLD